MASERRRRILRFFGAAGDLLAAEAPGVVVYDDAGRVRFRAEVGDFLDLAPVGTELWALAPDRLTRLSSYDGRVLGTEPIEYLDGAGRFLLSATAPLMPVWHAAQPALIRAEPARAEVPGPGGDLVLPIADGRWLLWENGQLRLWRTIGEAWRKRVGDPGARAVDAQLLLNGRLFVLVQQRGPRGEADGAELRLSVVQVSDGAQNTQLRLPAVQQLAIAARRGLAVARTGDRLSVIDLRFGRWLRDLVLPPGVTEFAVDDALQRIALGTADGLELARPDALAPQPHAAAPDGDAAPRKRAEAAVNGESHAVAIEVVAERVEEPPPEPALPAPEEPWPDAPLARLAPVTVTTTAAPDEIARSVELRLQLIGARVHTAIAEAWDSGRISKPDPMRPPFADEVAGLLQLGSGRAADDLDAATHRLRALEDLLVASERDRAGRLTPLEVLAHDFGLSQVGVAILFAVVAPRLRGELARLYGILANDPGRPVIDEFLLCQLLGPGFAPQIARELDGDRPLRRFGLVRVAPGDRPFAALAVDPLVARYIANQPPEGEPDLHLHLRPGDRTLDELQLPRPLVAKALRFLASAREDEPARIVVRGRTGAGRHTLLATLASLAGRSLGVIDLGTVPREPGKVALALEAVLRRAMLRGLVPCVDGLEVSSSEDPDT